MTRVTSVKGRPVTDYTNLFRLDGRQALVVGAGGIGGELALALASQGAVVHCADRDPDTAAAASERVGQGRDPVLLDVTDPAQVAAVAAALPDLDVVVLTAATNVRKRIMDYLPEDFERVVRLNLSGTFNVLQAFGRPMLARGGGASSPSPRSARRSWSPASPSTRRPRPGSTSSSRPPRQSSARAACG